MLYGGHVYPNTLPCRICAQWELMSHFLQIQQNKIKLQCFSWSKENVAGTVVVIDCYFSSKKPERLMIHRSRAKCVAFLDLALKQIEYFVLLDFWLQKTSC